MQTTARLQDDQFRVGASSVQLQPVCNARSEIRTTSIWTTLMHVLQMLWWWFHI